MLGDILRQNKSLRKLTEESALERELKKAWPFIFGKLANDLSFGYLKDQILHVAVHNYLWITEISYFKKEILSRLKESMPKEKIKDIKPYFEKRTSKRKPVPKPEVASSKNRSFEATIILENQRKKSLGYQYCPSCGKILVKAGICFFCRNRTDPNSVAPGKLTPQN